MTTFDLENTNDSAKPENINDKSIIAPSEKGDMASQLSKLIESGNLKTKTFTEATLAIQDTKSVQDKQPRGGLGTKIVPGSLKPTLQKALDHDEQIKKLETRLEQNEASNIDKSLRELEASQAIFTQNIKTLQNKLSKKPAPAEEKRLNIMLSMARDHMMLIEKILPVSTTEKEYNNDVFKKSVTRFKEYEEARRKQMLAEINQLQGRIPEEEVMAVRRKANYLYGEIFELTKQEGVETPQENTVTNVETTKATIMPENPQAPSQPQEVPATPASAVAQPTKLNQEALDLLRNEGGVPMFVTANLRKIAKENGISVLSSDTPNSVIEKLRALDNGEVAIPQVATVTESASAEPTITIEPAQGAENSLQDEALAILENEGGLVPEATPEPEVAKEITVENITEAIAPVEASENSKVETAEEKKERILKAIYDPERAAALEARAEKAGVLDIVRNAGETFNKFPLRYKVLFSLGMIASGTGAALAGATATAGAISALGVGMRYIGGVGTFATLEKVIRNSKYLSAKNSPVVWKGKTIFKLSDVGAEYLDTVHAALLSIIIVSVVPGLLRDHMLSPLAETAGKISEFYNDAPLAHAEAPVATAVSPENLVAAGSFIEIAQPGDSIWKMTEHQLETQMGEKFTSLSPEQQTYLIDAVKDRIEQNPDAFGVADINNIEVGKGIDFTNALNDKEFIANALAHAQGLSPEEIANIKNYEGDTIPEAEARMLTPEEITALANGEVKGFDVIPNAEVVPVGAEGIPTAEAVPVGILEPSPVSEAIAHPDAHIKVGNIEGTFKYSPDGKVVTGFISTGTLEYPQTLEAQKILNDGWRGTVLSNGTGLSSLNTSIVENRAATIFQYEQLLEAFEKQGGGMTPEADYLREQITNIVTDTEKTYGDVFKDIGGTSEVVSAIPMEEPATMPQEINPGNPEVATSASKYVHDYINDMFGTKGIFGFGAVDGMKTPNWLDFANRPVAEIMQAQPNPTPSSAGLDVGIKNNDALAKIQQYLKVAIDETGVQPARGETTEKFLNRAASSTLEKIK